MNPTIRCGGAESFHSHSRDVNNGVAHFDPFSPTEGDVKAGIAHMLQKGTMNMDTLKKHLGRLHAHWMYAPPGGPRQAANSPFALSSNPWIEKYLHNCERRLVVHDASLEELSDRVALPPSLAWEIRLFAFDLKPKLLGDWAALGDARNALTCDYRNATIILFTFTFGPRAINAYFVTKSNLLFRNGEVVFFHHTQKKKNNPQCRGRRRNTGGSQLYRRKLPDSPWARDLAGLLAAWDDIRTRDAAEKGLELPAEFFLLAGERPVKDQNANGKVSTWLKDIVFGKLGSVLNFRADESISSHSLREGGASSFYYLFGSNDMLFLKWWFCWDEGSDVPEQSYIKCHTWGTEEKKPATYFFGMLKRTAEIDAQREREEAES